MKKITALFIVGFILVSSLVWADKIILTWQDDSLNETGFRCERQESGGNFSQVCEVGSNIQTWTDTSANLGVPYCYKIRAYGSAGESADSNTACVTLSAQVPGAPQNLTCTVVPTVLPPPLPTGLVLAMSFNEGNGTVAKDSSGKKNTGALSGPTWTIEGKYGAALMFDGVNDMVSVPDANSLDLTTSMTLEGWVYPTTINGWRTFIVKERPGELIYSLYVSDGGQKPSAIARIGSAKEYLDSPSSLPVNTWSHLAVTYDGSQYRLYINGQQVIARTLTKPMGTSNNALRIGGNSIWGEYFQGKIDEVRIYNQALSGTQIQSDMITPLP